ncbi:beta-ketoacyl-ACP synthase II [Kallotenue papyrolyticum]|uniref:beta-ketoacyl-ACP synthase II n=1 Tax=Kallotenue papyrolyticum TaxID=1325125 RepID=UPI0004786620|nr:beta-ketoacyl-ACP synthase II [Kallotenue papyrolyticum]
MARQPRVVITGMGAVTPLGLDVPALWQGIKEARSAVAPITSFDASAFDTKIAAEVKGFDPSSVMDRKEARRTDRVIQFAIAATAEALRSAELEITPANGERVGVLIGSGIGGIATLSEAFRTLFERGPGRVSPFTVPMMIADMPGGMVSIRWGAKGPNYAPVSACATSGNAIGEAADIIRRGDADVMIAGGTEAGIVPIAIAAFNAAQALSERNDEPERASRPFDATRDGFVMGEGAGVLILERLEHAQARGAPILAEVLGYGTTADAYHITMPDELGTGAARAMELAIRQAGLTPADIDYLNAHGTSTPANDRLETMAIKKVFGEHAYRLPVSSSKSQFGHLLGAAGAVEAIVTVLAMREGLLPATINYQTPDPECDLDYVPNTPRPATITYAMSNSFGFGGHNVSLLFGQFRE